MKTFQDWHKSQNPNDIITMLAVPSKTYDKVQTHQIIRYDQKKYNFLIGENPVALKGALECRIAKHTTQSNYLHSVWKRYIQMKKITCVNRQDWVDVVYKLPRPRRYYQSNSIEAARPFWMVTDNRILIKGKSYEIENFERLKIIQSIFGQVKKIKLP
jgi:hypothetical protein